jgi:hypothetical protein
MMNDALFLALFFFLCRRPFYLNGASFCPLAAFLLSESALFFDGRLA